MRKRKYVDTDTDLNRWTVSYADFITLMFAFFVMLYATSKVNHRVGTSGAEHSETVGIATLQDEAIFASVLDDWIGDPIYNLSHEFLPLDIKNQPSTDFVRSANSMEEPVVDKIKLKAVIESQKGLAFEKMITALKENIDPKLKDKTLVMKGYEHWVELEINSNILFHSGESQPSQQAKELIAQFSYFLNEVDHPIRVEGHTDNIPIFNQKFPSNWELSAARAASIVRLMVTEKINPKRLSAVGFGEHQPRYDNSDPEEQAKNRRVSILILRNSEI